MYVIHLRRSKPNGVRFQHFKHSEKLENKIKLTVRKLCTQFLYSKTFFFQVTSVICTASMAVQEKQFFKIEKLLSTNPYLGTII